MPAQVTNYKCPACTGPLHFVGATGKLECDYCGSTFDVSYIESLMQDAEQKAEAAAEEGWDLSDLSSDWGAEGGQMRVYNCPSCGAELICEETTAATSCPYCGNTTIVPGQFSGMMKPEYVIPFKLDKEAAKTALRNHYHGKRLLPKEFTENNHIEEIKGVYIPFWLFDGVAEADLQFEATRSFSHRQGNYEVTTTEHFNIQRSGSVAFDKVPVDASNNISDDLMDSIEPYDYSGLTAFSTAYLPGFLADKYDVSAEDCAGRADTRCENTVVSALSSTVTGYETCVPIAQDVRLHRGKVHYALLPVWLLNTKWDGKNFMFAMNGQTGKLVGDLPVSWKKFWLMFAAIAAPVAAVMAGIMYFLSV